VNGVNRESEYQEIVEELRKNTQFLNIIEIEITRLEYKLRKIDKKLSSLIEKKRRSK
jgi:hypothetical protein